MKDHYVLLNLIVLRIVLRASPAEHVNAKV